jgi:aspartyl-tRNA(Asn)/glutamyl-tRNA(Gln) amidotransferase subunit A
MVQVREALAKMDELTGTPWANFVACRDDHAAPIAAATLEAELATGRPRGPLHRVPIVVKDNIDVAGMPTTWGVPIVGLRPPT